MTFAPLRLLRGLVTAALALTWIVLAHLASSGLLNPDVAVMTAVLPAVAAACLLLWRSGRPGVAAAAGIGALALLLLLWPALRAQPALLFYLQHLGINLALASLFGRTLSGGREALISRLSRLAHGGEISPARARYTRRVTIAWTAFFLACAALSTGLYWLAPASVWSVFANVLTGPLIALMFLVEYLIRRRVLPPGDRSGLAQAIRAYRGKWREAH